MSDLEREQQAVQRMLARERLGIDTFERGRTSFLSHLGAWDSLVPGPWIAHRELIYALALANLSPQKRSALAKSVVVDWEREFGVGRLVLRALKSELPLGGSSLHLAPRSDDGLACLYTWALGPGAQTAQCDWLLLRAQPEWAIAPRPRPMTARGLETLVGIGGEVVVALPSAVAARQVADLVRDRLPWTAHPRFAPHLHDASELDENGEARSSAVAAANSVDGRLYLWPHDQLNSPKLRGRDVTTLVLVGATEAERQRAERWAASYPRIEVVDAACPGRMTRAQLLNFWRGCGSPKVLLRGDPAWTGAAATWLESEGVAVARQSKGTQLGLFGA